MRRFRTLVALLAIVCTPTFAAAKDRKPANDAVQAALAEPDHFFNTRQWDEAIAAYRAILANNPAITIVRLQIAAAYRAKAEYDSAVAVYLDFLDTNDNDAARIGLGMTYLEKGDLDAAERTLLKVADGRSATREVFYDLGELKLAQGRLDEAMAWYERARSLDPDWDRPAIRLAAVVAYRNERNANVASAAATTVARIRQK
ncbi:MAG TPA: tetratricopeptide repeat protein [Vicinamibacterales bacterium]